LRASAASRYVAALNAEIDRESTAPASTIFFGGGTPNAYDAAAIVELLARLRARFPAERNAYDEISIEVNPELVKPGDFERYREGGIDRVSIGVQSFVDAEIKTLGRRHTVTQVEAAVRAARVAGMRSVSLDLMFAVPGQTPQTWMHSIDVALSLGIDHISTYGLTIEEGTPYAAWQVRDPGAFFDDEHEAELYSVAIDRLEAAGFEHYEISNFARPGHRSVHNANYWANGEYVGLGVSAASYRGGVRSSHTRDFAEYVEAATSGAAIPGESERLVGAKKVGEAIMLALRTEQGVSVAHFKERYRVDVLRYYAPVIERYAAAQKLNVDEERIRLTREGRFVANDVCGAFVVFE
jgi:oxygen-independent coproporphyrinogen-3 oxidase